LDFRRQIDGAFVSTSTALLQVKMLQIDVRTPPSIFPVESIALSIPEGLD
jgi:hypothetical protein